jgi:chemotaxis signal transduction protein
MNQPVSQRVHILQIPIRMMTIVIPISNTAEVINVGELVSIPCSPAWVQGAVAWRNRAIPVFAFEALLGKPISPITSRSKVVIFNPLVGRRDWEFFGMLSTSEPHPGMVDNVGPLTTTKPEFADNPYVAAEIRLEEKLGLIPNLDTMARIFYP